jgi:hypothetical protein
MAGWLMRRRVRLGLVLASALVLALGLARCEGSGSHPFTLTAASVPAAGGCCWTLQDRYDQNYIVDEGHNYAVQMFPAPGAPWAANLIDCAQKYTAIAGWQTYCLYQDDGSPSLCLNVANGYVYSDGCNSGANSEYIWHDGNWLVSLSASQGQNYSAYLQAYDEFGVEHVKVLHGGGAWGANQWNFA